MKISTILQKIGKFFGFIPKDKEVIRYCKLLALTKVENNIEIIRELYKAIDANKLSIRKEDGGIDSFLCRCITHQPTNEFVFKNLQGYYSLYNYVISNFKSDLDSMNDLAIMNQTLAYQERWYLHLIDDLVIENKRLCEVVKTLDTLGEQNG